MANGEQILRLSDSVSLTEASSLKTIAIVGENEWDSIGSTRSEQQQRHTADGNFYLKIEIDLNPSVEGATGKFFLH